MNNLTQQKTVDLARGLFLIRYNSADDDLSPPTVRVFPDRPSAENCRIIVSPDSSDGTLWAPPSGLVVMATQPCRLVVEVTPQNPGGSVAANIKIEPLHPGQRPARPSARYDAAQTLQPSFEDFRILAHVAGVGDVSEGLDRWIAGPAAPARIEGLSLHWPGKPYDLEINYAVKFARPQPGDNVLVPLGTFAGTRGRALPLTGVVLETSGPSASRYALTAEAIFLGSPAIRIAGQRINLIGPSGREPLVGIRINLVSRDVQVPAPQTLREQPVAPAPRPGGRVRVFRSRQSAAKPVSG
jgi:hypothetical protein